MKNFDDVLKYTKTMTLLYVEDNEDVRNTTLEIFNDLFKSIIVAIDGEDGLDKFFDHEIDIVFTDINMPKLNGIELAEKILDFDSNIPILFNSAHHKTEYFTKAIELNINGYLLKPLDINILFENLRKIIKKIQFQETFDNNISLLHQYHDLTDTYTAVSKTNLKGIIIYVNKEFCKLTGYSENELIGKNHNIIRHKDNVASIYTDLWHCIQVKKEIWRGKLKNVTKEGKANYTDIAIKPIVDSNNNILEYISIRKDVTDMMSPKKILYDFVESSNEALLVLVKTNDFLDIEKFYGFKSSQKIENKFADSLFNLMPKHIGFNKFLSLGNGEYIFAQDIGIESSEYMDGLVQELIDLQKSVNMLKIDIGEIDYDISVVISIANGQDCIENVFYGIKALEYSKQDLIIANDFSKKEQANAENNLKILKMVKRALENSNIISYFQPIISNKTQDIVKYESLVRLVDENEKIISPFIFLDIAKKGKYYSQITARVLENSFDALYKTDKEISINISALDIEKPTTVDKIFELLELHNDVTHRVIFELLEDENVKDINQIEKFISKVKSYGVRIAVDDFGAGYSNFERLLKYQPDILKIDGSLIKNIESDTYSLSVVKSIVAFAKEQKIEMVAEYIENENIYNILKDLGVEYSQGYYFGKPALMES